MYEYINNYTLDYLTYGIKSVHCIMEINQLIIQAIHLLYWFSFHLPCKFCTQTNTEHNLCLLETRIIVYLLIV